MQEIIRDIVAEVYVKASGSYGSGILLGPGTLLTASHTLRDEYGRDAGGCDARLGTGTHSGWRTSKVVWRDRDCDAALLTPANGGTYCEASKFFSLRFGMRPSRERPCRVLGFPKATDNEPARFNDLFELRGTIRPLTFIRSQMLAVNIDGAVPVRAELWKGISGAGVVCGRTLVGIAVKTVPEFGSRMLKCVPCEALLRDQRWRALLETDRPAALDTFVDAADQFSCEEVALDPDLRERLERRAALCAELGFPFRTFHKLKVLMEMHGGFSASCFEAAKPGSAEAVTQWLNRLIRDQSERAGSVVSSPLDQDPTIAAARISAAREGSSAVDERHMLLAILSESSSGTISKLAKYMKDDMKTLEQIATERRPAKANLGVTNGIQSI